MKNVGSLFSGIGGFELGFAREGFRTKWFIENNEYCQAVLRKNFPNIPIYEDIREIDFRKLERIEIITGGFPCQDISCANPRGEGISGERSGLWSYYAKAIREIRPKYAIVENVPMLANRGLNVVLGDLAENGYDAEWFCLRASDFGALHRRERLFVIAYPNSMRLDDTTTRESIKEYNGIYDNEEEKRCEIRSEVCGCGVSSNITNSNEQLRNEIHGRQPNDEGGIIINPSLSRLQTNRCNFSTITNGQSVITHDWDERIQRFCTESLQGEQGFSWCQDVRRIEDLQERPDIPQPLFRGGRDGIPNWMDRIKCCGNAVVPQVAQFIARRIKEIENE